MKYCQPTITSSDSTMARMVFLCSLISMLVLTVPRFGTYLTLAAAAFGRARPMWGQRARCTSSAAVFASVALAEAMDAAKCNAEFLEHGVKRASERGAPSNQ